MLNVIPVQIGRSGRATKSAPIPYRSKAPARAAIPATPRPPRNHGGKWSLHLSEVQAVELVEAAAHAVIAGRPLNRFVSIHLEKGEVLGRAQDHIGVYLRLVGQWLGYRGVPATYLWVLEHAAGTGLHVHMLLHVPRALWPEYKRRQKRWLQRAGIAPVDGVLDDQRVGPRGMDWQVGAHRRTYKRQLTGLLRYLLKGIDSSAIASIIASERAPGQKVAEALRIDPEPSTAIYGRRCSMSNNIRAKARAAYTREPVEQELTPTRARDDGGGIDL